MEQSQNTKIREGRKGKHIHIHANMHTYVNTIYTGIYADTQTKEEEGNVHGAWKGARPALDWTAEPPGNRDTHLPAG